MTRKYFYNQGFSQPLRYLFENLNFKAFGQFWINNLSLLNY